MQYLINGTSTDPAGATTTYSFLIGQNDRASNDQFHTDLFNGFLLFAISAALLIFIFKFKK